MRLSIEDEMAPAITVDKHTVMDETTWEWPK